MQESAPCRTQVFLVSAFYNVYLIPMCLLKLYLYNCFYVDPSFYFVNLLPSVPAKVGYRFYILLFVFIELLASFIEIERKKKFNYFWWFTWTNLVHNTNRVHLSLAIFFFDLVKINKFRGIALICFYSTCSFLAQNNVNL